MGIFGHFLVIHERLSFYENNQVMPGKQTEDDKKKWNKTFYINYFILCSFMTHKYVQKPWIDHGNTNY